MKRERLNACLLSLMGASRTVMLKTGHDERTTMKGGQSWRWKHWAWRRSLTDSIEGGCRNMPFVSSIEELWRVRSLVILILEFHYEEEVPLKPNIELCCTRENCCGDCIIGNIRYWSKNINFQVSQRQHVIWRFFVALHNINIIAIPPFWLFGVYGMFPDRQTFCELFWFFYIKFHRCLRVSVTSTIWGCGIVQVYVTLCPPNLSSSVMQASLLFSLKRTAQVIVEVPSSMPVKVACFSLCRCYLLKRLRGYNRLKSITHVVPISFHVC